MGGEVTRYLTLLGDAEAPAPERAEARDRLFELLYQELRRVAGRIARENRGTTLQATALLHEAWLRLAGREDPVRAHDRQHFMRTAALAMRRVLLDHLRARGTQKRGGERDRVPLDDLADAYQERAGDLEALDAGLAELTKTDERAAATLELHFFAGLSAPEIAEVFAVSPRTVRRDLEFARTWLRRHLA